MTIYIFPFHHRS